MDGLIVFAFAAAVTYQFGTYVGHAYLREPPTRDAMFGGLVTFIAAAIFAAFVIVPAVRLLFGGAGGALRLLNPFRARRSPGVKALLSSPPGRRLFGLVMNAVVLLVVALPFYGLPVAVFAVGQLNSSTLWPGWAWAGMAALVVGACLACRRWAHRVKLGLGRRTRKLRYWVRSLSFGRGGSAAYASIFEDWGEGWEPGSIRQGGSIYDPRFTVGGTDDRHFITIATTRSGKGRSCIIPNLLTWPGSALVVDVKGQNAMVTAEARRAMGQEVRIVDPFGVLKSMKVEDPVARWNPLAEIDPRHPNAYEDVDGIAEALVVMSGSASDPYWDESAQGLLVGTIAHVLTWPGFPKEARNLGLVYHLLTRQEGLPVDDMLNNFHPNLGDTVQSVGANINELAEDTRRCVFGSVRNHIKWLNSGSMKNTLAVSDFSVRDLKQRPTTIYLVIPPHLLKTHNRFLRLFVNVALSAFTRDQAKGEKDCLLLLDEFYSLGRLERLTTVMANLAGYGVRVWTIIQNIGQLVDLYGKNWETFLGQAGRWQVFAMNDSETMNYLSKRMGKHVMYGKQRLPSGRTEWTPVGSQFFREPQELAIDSNRRNMQQLVFTEGGDAHFLLRQNYDETFKKSQYRQDPYEVRGRWGGKVEPEEIEPEEETGQFVAPHPSLIIKTREDAQAMDAIHELAAEKKKRAPRKADGQKAVPRKRKALSGPELMTGDDARAAAAKLIENTTKGRH